MNKLPAKMYHLDQEFVIEDGYGGKRHFETQFMSIYSEGKLVCIDHDSSSTHVMDRDEQKTRRITESYVDILQFFTSSKEMRAIYSDSEGRIFTARAELFRIL